MNHVNGTNGQTDRSSELLMKHDDETDAEFKIRQETGFVIEADPRMRDLWRFVRMSRDQHMLVLGETGSDKEHIPQLIGRLTGRETNTINCGALSKDVAESELFGHTKGAFTGSGSDRPGLFGSTKDGGIAVFDEIGHLDPRLQPTVLRALDPGKFKPVGSDKEQSFNGIAIGVSSDPLDGRMIAPLLNRFNGWQITVPPLRERDFKHRYFLSRFLAAKRGWSMSSETTKDFAERTFADSNVRGLRDLIAASVRFAMQRGEQNRFIHSEDIAAASKICGSPSVATQSSVPTLDSTQHLLSQQNGNGHCNPSETFFPMFDHMLAEECGGDETQMYSLIKMRGELLKDHLIHWAIRRHKNRFAASKALNVSYRTFTTRSPKRYEQRPRG